MFIGIGDGKDGINGEDFVKGNWYGFCDCLFIGRKEERERKLF